MIRRMQKDSAQAEDVTEHVSDKLAEQEESRDANEAAAMFKIAPAGLVTIEHGPTSAALSEANEAISEETGSNDATRLMFSERPPDADLLIDQLMRSTPACNDNDLNEKLQDASVGLYLSFKPQDAVDSVLARLIVAVSNASMESFGQAAKCFQSEHARELYVRLGLKGSEAATKLIELLDRRRGRVPKPLRWVH